MKEPAEGKGKSEGTKDRKPGFLGAPSPAGCRVGSAGLFPKRGGRCSSSPTDPGLTCRNAMACLLKSSFNSTQRWPCGSEQVGSLLRNRWELFQMQNEMCLTKINMVINKSSYASGFGGSNRLNTKRKRGGGTAACRGPTASPSPPLEAPTPAPPALRALLGQREKPSPGKHKLWLVKNKHDQQQHRSFVITFAKRL